MNYVLSINHFQVRNEANVKRKVETFVNEKQIFIHLELHQRRNLEKVRQVCVWMFLLYETIKEGRLIHASRERKIRRNSNDILISTLISKQQMKFLNVIKKLKLLKSKRKKNFTVKFNKN